MVMAGAGTRVDPYIIKTPQDLDDVRDNLSASYRLNNDIDMAAFGNFNPIGDIFTGNFDGDGRVIFNLTINTTTSNTGLFASVNSATISKLGVENVYITSLPTTNYTGGLVGSARGFTTRISECYVTGAINAGYTIGGLIGYTHQTTVVDCYTRCTVTGTNNIGGLIGSINASTIRNNYTVSPVYGGATRGSFFGVVGSYNTYSNNFLDGTIGYGNTGGSAILSVSTARMKSRNLYPSQWDFNTIWQMLPDDYPTLQVFNAKIKKETVVANSYTEAFQIYHKLIKRKVETTLTFTHPIAQSIQKELVESCVSYIKAIASSATVIKNANMKTYAVTSSLAELAAHSTMGIATKRHIHSYIDLMESQITVIIPIEVKKPIYANVFYYSNVSTADYLTGTSAIFYEENQTETSVI